MADLSRLDQRTQTQDRVTNNRTGVLPARRNTEAPDRKVFADLRTARRGDVGGADELAKIFGGVKRAGHAFSDYAEQRQGAQDKEDATEGQLDSITGEEDPELAERSRAYRVSFQKGRAEKDTLVRIQSIEAKVQARLSDPDNKADMEDVDELIQEDLQDFLKRDFGSPEAKEVAFAHLRQATAAARASAFKVIQEQVNEESLDNSNEVLRLKLEQGLPVTFEETFTNLLPTVDRKAAKAYFIQTIKNYVVSLEEKDPARALRVTDDLLDSRRDGGSSPIVGALQGAYSLSPNERADLLAFRERVASQIETAAERALKEKQETNADLLLTRFLGNGRYPTTSEVQELVRTGEIGAEHGWQAFGIIMGEERGARAEARQARAEALEVIREAREQRTQARISNLLAPVYSGKASVSSTAAGLLAAAAAIPDPDERQAVIGAVRAELNAVEDLRERSPSYTSAMDGFDRLEAMMIRNLNPKFRGERRDKAVKDIKDAVNRQRVFVGRAAKDRGYDAVKGLSDAERLLTDNYLKAYGL